MKVSTTWSKDLEFTGHGESGSTLHLSPQDSGEGFRPMDLLAMSLAGCTGMDVISLLKKKRQDVHALEIIVSGEQIDEHPRVYKKLSVEYVITGKSLDQRAVDRCIELSATKYCPAAAMLGETANITHTSRLVQVDD